MLSLLLLVLLVAFASGCRTTPAGPCAPGDCPGYSGSGYTPYTAGYRRPCYPAYRPIDSAYLP
jgi:hypothetical protein